MIGEWDIEIEVEFENSLELSGIIQQLYKYGEGRIREVLSHMLAEVYRG
jgi:hypothetical protein